MGCIVPGFKTERDVWFYRTDPASMSPPQINNF